ncbi:hypothetical protein [Phaffia rhodozyma]|uniref:Uncharacterized protein n=1 Tax=Phaffia rhodozyma TaxID=264483 RepID=A0A0F7SMZ0_PHARH|nr:hypothetical protein [Phaffia rhodozyma]
MSQVNFPLGKTWPLDIQLCILSHLSKPSRQEACESDIDWEEIRLINARLFNLMFVSWDWMIYARRLLYQTIVVQGEDQLQRFLSTPIPLRLLSYTITFHAIGRHHLPGSPTCILEHITDPFSAMSKIDPWTRVHGLPNLKHLALDWPPPEEIQRLNIDHGHWLSQLVSLEITQREGSRTCRLGLPPVMPCLKSLILRGINPVLEESPPAAKRVLQIGL